MNTEIDNISAEDALSRIEELIRDGEPSYVVTPNVDHIVKLENDKELQDAYKNANLILADGKPLIWISKLYRRPIKEKISGSDLFPRLCKLSAEKQYRLFFLGAAEGVALKAAEKLTLRFPGLKVVGTYSPPIGFENHTDEISKIIELITLSKPHVLIVALGCPKQEVFMYKYRYQLEVPVSLGLGACLDFEAGVLKRAPKWMSKNGFEWLYRIFQEPKRMIKRYLIDDIKIAGLIIKYGVFRT